MNFIFQQKRNAEKFSYMRNSWLSNPFHLSKYNLNLTTTFQDKLLKSATDEGLNINFENRASFTLFWIKK